MVRSFVEFISEELVTYRMVVPCVAKIYIACHKRFEPDSVCDSAVNSRLNPKELQFSLKRDFAYGGSRLANYLEDKVLGEKMAIRSVNFLALAESHMKHAIINQAIEDGALDFLMDEKTHQVLKFLKAENSLQIDIEIGHKVPEGYLDLKIRGSRCIILPESLEVEEILKDPKHHKFNAIADKIFGKVGEFLNGNHSASLVDSECHIIGEGKISKGDINLTPDFGRFAEMADILNKYTPQVLCVNANAGGCGGKVAYTVTGILAGWKACADAGLCSFNSDTSITFIGSAGALGEVIVEYLREHNFKKVRLCDLQYNLNELVEINSEADFSKLEIHGYTKQADDSFLVTTLIKKNIKVHLKDKLIRLMNGGYQAISSGWEIIPSIEGMYTDEALRYSGEVILSTAFGREIENSNYHLIPSGTVFLAAHNIAIRLGNSGLKIVDDLEEQDVVFIPGQVLTLGGALTSRLEACYRAEFKITKANEGKNTTVFPKRLGHEIVKDIVYHITSHIIARDDVNVWEALLEYGGLKKLLTLNDDEELNDFIPYDIRYAQESQDESMD